MKTTSLYSNPFSFKPALSPVGHWQPARPAAGAHRPRRFACDADDTLAQKQEIICGVILALSLIAAFAMSICQLAVA